MSKRVLFVAMLNPFVSGGGSQATKAYMDATIHLFGRENVDVMINKGVPIPDGYKNIRFIFVPQRPKWKAYMLFPFGILGRFSQAAAKYIDAHDSEYVYCIINGCMEAGWCYKHVRSVKVKKVTIHHNLEVKYNMDTKKVLTLWGKWPYTLRAVERNAYKFSDYNLFLTQQDMEEMGTVYGHTNAKNRLIGTFDYKDAEVIRPRNEGKCFHIVASGTMGHYQTTHGVLDFYHRFFPIAQKMIPDLRVLLTGRNPSPEIKGLVEATQNVITIVPNPDDIMEQVQRGQIYLCPTDIGSGLKLRAMDGLKCGLPVLVHEVSARGYDFFYGKPYYRVYKDVKSFEKGLKDILLYLKNTPDSAKKINNDYYEFFGFIKGVDRFRSAIDL